MFSFGETQRDRERRVGNLEGRVERQANSLESQAVNLTTIATEFRNHAAGCEKRGARLEKLAYILLVMMVGMLGFLLTPYFQRNPQNITIYQHAPQSTAQPQPSNP